MVLPAGKLTKALISANNSVYGFDQGTCVNFYLTDEKGKHQHLDQKTCEVLTKVLPFCKVTEADIPALFGKQPPFRQRRASAGITTIINIKIPPNSSQNTMNEERITDWLNG